MSKDVHVWYNKDNNCWTIKAENNYCYDNKYKTLSSAVCDAKEIAMECGCELCVHEKNNDIKLKKNFRRK